MTGPVTVGIDVGGGSVKSVVFREASEVDRHLEDRRESLTESIRATVDRWAGDHRVEAVGVGIAGLVDHVGGRFVWGPHVSGGPVDVRSVVAGRRVVVDNDANLAAFAEATRGPGTGRGTVLAVSLGTGIGAGLVVDGRIQRGHAFAGEVGHMRLVDDGAPCACGRTGCWETLVSGWSLARKARELDVGLDAASLGEAADRGHDGAGAVIAEAGRWLGVGIANLVLAMDPSIVVVAGGVSTLGDRILDPARDWIASAMPGAGHRPEVEIVASGFGRWAAATGAALAASAAHESTDEDRT